MGSKLNPGKFDCYTNALPDEPMFVLLARDPFAPELVRMWARTAELANRGSDAGRGPYAGAPKTSGHKVAEAMQCADDMKAWREANPKPDGGYPVREPRVEGAAAAGATSKTYIEAGIPVAYLRDIGDPSDVPCYVPAAKDDPGAFAVYR